MKTAYEENTDQGFRDSTNLGGKKGVLMHLGFLREAQNSTKIGTNQHLISDECQKPKRRSVTNCILLGSHTHKISTDHQSDEEEVTKSNKPKIDNLRHTEKH
jgi:hypothetical protein